MLAVPHLVQRVAPEAGHVLLVGAVLGAERSHVEQARAPLLAVELVGAELPVLAVLAQPAQPVYHTIPQREPCMNDVLINDKFGVLTGPAS